jgi:hypothetical protein
VIPRPTQRCRGRRTLANGSGGKTPDYYAADAFVALCTAILYAEGACRAAIDGDPFLKELEGAVWVPSIACSEPG